MFNKINGFVLIITVIGILCGLNIYAQDTLTIRPGPAEGEDVELHTFWPDSARRHTDDICAVSWTSGGEPFISRTIFQFDLSALNPDCKILSARLSLYSNPGTHHYQGNQGQNECYLRRITEPWQEATVTWNTQPAATSQNQVYLPQSTDPFQDYPEIDVTQLVQDMVLDPENSHGFMLRLITEETYRSLVFASSDHVDPEQWPELEIIYRECTPLTIGFDFIVDGYTIGFIDHSEVSCEIPVPAFSYTLEGMNVSFFNHSSFASEWFWDFGDGYSAC
jgi:hypothetical protein